ncbi:MAG: hypothetical protein IKY82_06230 [Alistipes sp.]|nr:hypothetical protein [Alistipes sp.]
MRHFFTLFAAFLSVSLLAIGAAYIDSKTRPNHNEEHIWHATLQRLGEFGRIKHHQCCRYERYAEHALQHQMPEAAKLFSAMAFAEEVKYENCKDAIGILGGVFDPPIDLPVKTASVEEHFQTIINEKQRYHDTKVRECIEGAIDEGNRFVARMMTWCDASDVKAILIIQRTLCQMEQPEGVATLGYRVCPRCGNIDDEALHSLYCPHCMTQQSDFLIFE